MNKNSILLKHIEIIDNKNNNIIKNKKFDSISCGMQYFDLYEQDGYRYMITPKKTGSLLLKDMNTKPINVYYMWWLYGAFVIVLFALFLSIAISTYPIKHLQVKIRKFGEGDMDLDFTTNKKDEISEVSNEFDNAVDLMFLNPDSIDHNLQKQDIDADFDLMSIVFKNLIDNGIKYSDDANVFIRLDGDDLLFCSKGDEMEYKLEYYIQPFTKCDINMQESFGLGLYIVYYILDKHDLKLSYKYKDGINTFIIHLHE